MSLWVTQDKIPESVTAPTSDLSPHRADVSMPSGEDSQSTPTSSPPQASREWLTNAIDGWVADGVIDHDQAAAIRRRHGLQTDTTGEEHADDPTRSRLVTAISIVGAALVGAGLLVFLGTNWESIPRALRTLLLVVAPPGAFGLGVRLTAKRGADRVGHALWILGAVVVGPCLLLLVDLYTINLDQVWLLGVWAAVAVLAAEGGDSRPTAWLAVALSAVVVINTAAPAKGLLALPALGIISIGHAAVRASNGDTTAETTADRLASSYRIAGVGVLTGGLLVIIVKPQASPDLVALDWLLAAVAGGVIGHVARSAQRPPQRALAGWLAASAIVTGLVVAVVAAIPTLLGELLGLLVAHALLFGLLLGAVAVGHRLAAPRLISAGVGFIFCQLAVFLVTTVADTLSSSLALVVTGTVLLVVAIGLERGRRSLLATL